MYAQDLKKYLDELAAKLPAPGGGSASALSSALGACLISMVINFTLGKPKYASYEKDLKDYLEKSEKLRAEFLNLVDLDVAAYNSKDPRKAMDVPLMICRLSLEGIKLCPLLIKKSNVNLISDVSVAAVLLEAGFTSAFFNVEINLKIINDPGLTASIRKELAGSMKMVKRLRHYTEVKVGKIIRG